MTKNHGRLPTFWTTVRVLLAAARIRAKGRRQRQQELLRSRSSGSATNWGSLGFALAILVMLLVNVFAAFAVRLAVESAQRFEIEKTGKIVVGRYFLTQLRNKAKDSSSPLLIFSEPDFADEAHRISRSDGGSEAAIEERLRAAFRLNGTRDFVSRDDAARGIGLIANTGAFPALTGSLMLLLWLLMLVTQGEGLELDIQRRRHPMWEWLFSHPVPENAVFLAEMISPIAANPSYWGGPLFVFTLFCFVYDPLTAALAGGLIGIPVTVAAACLGKAVEIAVMLRLPSRSRGAVIGLMSWFGYASSMYFFLGFILTPKAIAALGGILGSVASLPFSRWPWLRLFLGGRPNGSFSSFAAFLFCWPVAGLVIAGAVRISLWGKRQGLSGGSSASGDSRPARTVVRFGRDPLYWKEFLWFIRDRSAIVQTILIPLTIAGVQLFNLRGVLQYARGSWNYLCGVAILFGTYFLWVLGPKSLASEGAALWISLTWPRGLESLLKAKAWLWSWISTGMVALVLAYAASQFPAELWKIGLVAVGWFFFSRSMSEKTVTLVTVTFSSGEQEKIPWGRRMAAQLGMLTFAIGVLTQQWSLAVIGIVYSYLTAAAMWQNFRARLPYLYDPWSERVPPPPTLMHAMVAISIMVELAAIITIPFLGFGGRESLGIALAIGYALSAVIVSAGLWKFLDDRAVANREIWTWDADSAPVRGSGNEPGGFRTLVLSYGKGMAGGLALGLLAMVYLAAMRHIPYTAEILRRSQAQMAEIPNLKVSFAVMAIAFAPFAEEYLFRGLLYRALDREWGGWRAVLGSAAFFAVYHPAMSWFPVAVLGACNALLFKKTGRLGPAVLLHMVYNALVVFFT
jgi:membrane protease YdiL (CAAX protease family)